MDSKIFLGKYRVSPEEIEAVGEPAESVLTYAAEEIDSGKKVVVEVVPAASLNAAARERLNAQAMAAKTLNHVNIAALYDFGVQGDHLVYVTEDFEGTTAEDWIKANGPMPIGPVLRIASQVVSALSAAAFHGIVHRAINPSHLVLAPGQTAQGEWPLVKVLHFVGGAPKIPGSDVAVAAFDKSTPYTSPEQHERGTVDFRSEIYSLGCTMWFLLNGVPPLITGPAPPRKAGLVGATKTALPKKVGDLLDQMLSTDPEARPADPLAFYRMLQDCLAQAEGGETIVRTSRTPAPRSDVIDARKSRRTPIGFVVRAAICLTMAAVTALVLREYLKHRPVVRADQPIEAPIGVTDAFASATPAEMKPTNSTVSIAPLPTAAAVVDANTQSVTTNSAESVSTKQIPADPLLTTSEPQASPPPQETRADAPNNSSDPAATADDSSEVAAAPQVEIVPAPAKSPDAEVSAVVLSPPKEIKTPEVRRAEPYDEPEVRKAELARSNEGPAEVERDRTPSPTQQTNSRAKIELPETTSLVLKRTDSKLEIAPKARAGETERAATPKKRQVDEKIYLLPGSEFDAAPERLPRGSVRGRFVGETADGKWMFELPSREIVTVSPPSHP